LRMKDPVAAGVLWFAFPTAATCLCPVPAGRPCRRLPYHDRIPEVRSVPMPEERSDLEALVERYSPFIRDIVGRLCPRDLGLDRSEIEQKAAIRLWRVIESEREIRDLESYLYRIVSRVTLDAIRDVKARREDQMIIGEMDSWTASPAMPGSASLSPEVVAGRRRLVASVREAIEKLPLKRRRAVKLHLLGFTAAEIGAFYGWSEAKARNLAYRGLDDLRELLTEAGVDDSD
jgi:RNA polymerase sigma factor (sigma-70 family)